MAPRSNRRGKQRGTHDSDYLPPRVASGERRLLRAWRARVSRSHLAASGGSKSTLCRKPIRYHRAKTRRNPPLWLSQISYAVTTRLLHRRNPTSRRRGGAAHLAHLAWSHDKEKSAGGGLAGCAVIVSEAAALAEAKVARQHAESLRFVSLGSW